ncbi:MAG: type II toxin-antitoxin system PemK/MazF family toxin [Nitrospiraceae bacterium]|nr:type II toxin-antitoxin system PemK/MazF family toxin [Nitrospiraceae bacterium]
MRRGELYRVKHPSSLDPRKFRVFVVVSRQVLIDSRFSTVVCAPVYTVCEGLTTQVPIGTDEGMKHDCSIHCDELISIPKSMLTDFVSTLPREKIVLLDEALRAALDLHGN